jgi:hypothetical protein
MVEALQAVQQHVLLASTHSHPWYTSTLTRVANVADPGLHIVLPDHRAWQSLLPDGGDGARGTIQHAAFVGPYPAVMYCFCNLYTVMLPYMFPALLGLVC